MIVEVTMHEGYATIESPGGKDVCMTIPLLRPLQARMGGEMKASFHAEMSHGNLELGDRVSPFSPLARR